MSALHLPELDVHGCYSIQKSMAYYKSRKISEWMEGDGEGEGERGVVRQPRLFCLFPELQNRRRVYLVPL